MKEEIENKEKDIEAYVTPEQIEQMEKITDEIKRLKGQKMVKKQIDELNKQLDELKKGHKNKQPTNKVVKLWVSGMKKILKWWTMSDLTPEQRREKREKFENASMDLFGSSNDDNDEPPNIFGGENSNNQRIPSIFGGSNDNDDERPDLFGDIAPMKRKNARKSVPNTKRGGKTSKKHTAKQKYVIRGGIAYPVIGEEQQTTKPRKKKRKKAITTKKQEKDESDDDRPMFFDIHG